MAFPGRSGSPGGAESSPSAESSRSIWRATSAGNRHQSSPRRWRIAREAWHPVFRNSRISGRLSNVALRARPAKNPSGVCLCGAKCANLWILAVFWVGYGLWDFQDVDCCRRWLPWRYFRWNYGAHWSQEGGIRWADGDDDDVVVDWKQFIYTAVPEIVAPEIARATRLVALLSATSRKVSEMWNIWSKLDILTFDSNYQVTGTSYTVDPVIPYTTENMLHNGYWSCSDPIWMKFNKI